MEKGRKRALESKKGPSNRTIALGLGVLVVGLVALVIAVLPAPGTAPSLIEEASVSEAAAIDRIEPFPVLPEATGQLAVLTDQPFAAIATVDAITARLDVRQCGPACDGVKAFVRDGAHFSLEITKTADLILPPDDTLDVVAPTLTPAERSGLHDLPDAIVVHVHGPALPDQLPARALFAATAVLAESLHAFVHDEFGTRRILRPEAAAALAITSPLGGPTFAPHHVAVQLYRQEDGTARLVTLGLARFGAPDLVIRNAPMTEGPRLADVLDAIGARVAAGGATTPIRIGLADVSQALGRAIDGGSGAVSFVAGAADRVDGDPDDIVEIAPENADEGSLLEAWKDATTTLFGEANEKLVADDAELAAVASRARASLPKAIARFGAGEGALYVKGPFPIPLELRGDGGPEREWLWLAAAACDPRACTGTLTGSPEYATNFALGKVASVARADVADWALRLPDGGTAGGESIACSAGGPESVRLRRG